MKRTGSAGAKSKSKSQSDEKKTFALCIRNDGYTASLEVRKFYQIITDEFASANGLVRVIDESGEDYLYPSDFFFFALSDPLNQVLQSF